MTKGNILSPKIVLIFHTAAQYTAFREYEPRTNGAQCPYYPLRHTVAYLFEYEMNICLVLYSYS